MSGDEEPNRRDEGSEPGADPFEHLDAGEREGDPFESLDAPGDGADDAAAPDPSDDAPAPKGGAGGDGLASRPSDRTDRARDPTGDPFGDFEARDGDPFAGDDGTFERVDVGEVDPDEVWNAVADEGDADDAPSASDGPVAPGESRYAEVSKHSFCEQCEHFSPPPDVGCAHEAAEIVEFLDMETVRLLNCPVVAERRRLEREH